jgi:S1-C subfamily serine protease
MAHQMVTESSLAFRVVTLGMMAGLIAAIAFVYQTASRRTAAAEDRLASAERAFSAQLRTATEAQQRSSQEIAGLEREVDAARRSAVSRAVLDSLERRLREAETRGVQPTASPSASPGPAADFTRVARENQRAVGLVIVSYASDSVMGSGFAITPSGYFVTNRHVVQDESRGPPRGILVVMAETNVALAADVMAVSSIAEQDIAVLKIRGYRGSSVRAVDWRGRGAQQGAPAAMLGFPLGTQLALDRLGYVHANMFGGIIAQTGEWIRFSSPTYAGVSGSPVFNADGEVIAVHFGAPRAGPGLGVSVPMSKVRQWLPAQARVELGL